MKIALALVVGLVIGFVLGVAGWVVFIARMGSLP